MPWQQRAIQTVSFILISSCYDNTEADMKQYSSVSDYRLSCHMMKMTKAADLSACTKECSQTPGCKSSNYKNAGEVCELNSADHVTHALCFGKDTGYIYFQNPNPKAASPQASGNTAVPNSKPYYKNCAKVKEAQPTAKSGLYDIVVDGVSKQIYCDMENFDGGWSLAVSISTSNNNHLLRTQNNCFNSTHCVPLITGTLASRKLKDTDIHSLASHEGTFRFDVTSTTATLYTVFYRLSQGPQMFHADCSGISCPRQIISHVYPYVWESNCKGIDVGYQINANPCYKVFDGHDNRDCGSAWVSSQYLSYKRVLYGFCTTTGIYNGLQGNMTWSTISSVFVRKNNCSYGVSAMFITVRFGDGEESLFNPYCRITALLEDIKRRCKCSKDAMVDLSDERGNLKFLVDHPLSYASDILKERESFVLIRIEKKPEEQGASYTPLLNDIGIVTSSFLERLSKYESDAISTKSSSTGKPNTAAASTTSKKANALTKAKAAFLSSPTRAKTRERSLSNKSPTLKKTSR